MTAASSVQPPSAPSGGDQTPGKIRAMFGAITPTYDRLNRLLSGSLDRRWRQLAAMAALERLAPCRRVLDVAAGTGDLTAELMALARIKYPSGAAKMKFIGADFTPQMLRRAREKYGERSFRWALADGTRLPFASGAFDAVTVAFGLRNMADRSAALREMSRVTREGGHVVILEFGQPANRLWARLYDFYSFQVLPRVGRLLSGSDAYVYLARSIREFWDAETLRDEMHAAGLREVTATPLLGGIVYLHAARKKSGE